MYTCPATNQECKFFEYQTDRNDDVAITFCNHPDNQNEFEGNTKYTWCPLIPVCNECGCKH